MTSDEIVGWGLLAVGFIGTPLFLIAVSLVEVANEMRRIRP